MLPVKGWYVNGRHATIFLVTGAWPTRHVYMADGDIHNTRFENLTYDKPARPKKPKPVESAEIPVSGLDLSKRLRGHRPWQMKCWRVASGRPPA